MKKLIAVIVFVLMALPAAAQTFTLSGRVAFVPSGGQKLVAADAISLTKLAVMSPTEFTLRTDSLFVSAASAQANLASFNLAGVQAKLPIGGLFTKLGLDQTKYEAYAFGEAGTVTNAAGTSKAFSAGAGIDRNGPGGTVINLFEAAWLHGGIPTGNLPTGGPQYTNDTARFSIGITLP